MTARPARFKQVELQRVLRAAEKAKCGPVRVDIDADGRITVVTGVKPDAAFGNSFD